jgi:tetratricopeptide (TPR) repeat protein
LEAAACGALLFQDATSHRETSDWLAAGREYIAYAAEDLELRLDHYLTHEDRRASLADAAYARVQSYSFEALWSAIVERIHADHHELRSRCARRVASATGLGLAGRVWQALASPTVPDPGLENAIADASKLEPENAHWCHLAGQIVTNPAQAAELFRRALSIDPNSVCSGLALVEAEARVGNAAGVTAAGRNVLAILNAIDRLRPMDRDVGFYHQNYDYLRVEWERASWENAGDAIAEDKAKRAVLAWRLHLRLADSGNDLTHYYEAALIRPELPVMRIALGCALARAGRMVQALPHLKRGVAEQPFDRTAARALAQALHDTGDAEGLASLKRDLLLFSRVAPDLLPPEPWFTANEPAPQSQKPRLTLAILCRDEPELLSGLLADASDLADEVVILDAVGDDSLSKTSRDVGARVVPFTWPHSYGDARNELLTHAHGDWVLWLDPADRLDDAQKQRLHLLIRQLPSANMAFTMRCHTDIGEVVQIRLHRRDPRIRWTYHAREQLSASLAQTGAKIISTDIVISRATMPDMANRRNRLMTDMRLLRRSEELYPRDPFVLSNLAAIYQELGDADKATAYLQTTLDVIGADDPRRPKLIAMLVLNLGRLGNAEDALDLCVEARKQFPNDGELFLLETMARREMGDEARAEQMLRAAVDRGESFVGVAMSLVRGQLAELLRKQERWQEAEAVWRAALIENPDFAAAHEGLATIYLMQKRWIELDSALERLKSIDSFGAELMKARIHLAKGEFGAARWQLSQLIDRHPHVMAPRLLLCNALIEEGKDWHAAERALIDVIERLPDDADAQRNLDLVRRKLGREPLG